MVGKARKGPHRSVGAVASWPCWHWQARVPHLPRFFVPHVRDCCESRFHEIVGLRLGPPVSRTVHAKNGTHRTHPVPFGTVEPASIEKS